MAELDTEDREEMDKRKFAYVDKGGQGHLPINDDPHVRNAMARFNQTDFESGEEGDRPREDRQGGEAPGYQVDRGDNVAKRRKKAGSSQKKTGR